jgi:MFS family permease
MAAFAVMILWHGALSDAFGRRSIILLSLAVYAIASIGCAAVHSIEYFWVYLGSNHYQIASIHVPYELGLRKV